MNFDVAGLQWRRATRSQNTNNCVEVAGMHDAPWRKSSRSNGSGGQNCVEATHIASIVAVRDSKLDTSGDFPHLAVSGTDWTGLLAEIRTGKLDG